MAKATANKSAAAAPRLAAPENFVGPELVGDTSAATVVGVEPPPTPPNPPCELAPPAPPAPTLTGPPGEPRLTALAVG